MMEEKKKNIRNSPLHFLHHCSLSSLSQTRDDFLCDPRGLLEPAAVDGGQQAELGRDYRIGRRRGHNLQIKSNSFNLLPANFAFILGELYMVSLKLSLDERGGGGLSPNNNAI